MNIINCLCPEYIKCNVMYKWIIYKIQEYFMLGHYYDGVLAKGSSTSISGDSNYMYL